jgi:DNA-binding beta-propeller fold protein YncE
LHILKFCSAVVALLWAATCLAADPVPLRLEGKIPLGEVKGRIDHLAMDLGRHRLFVAELENDTVAVVDIQAGQVLRRLTGFKEPQGIGYVPATDMVYVANAGDGTVRIFKGSDYAPVSTLDLGDDADNIRVDLGENRVYVGYGAGAIAIIDPRTRQQIGTLPLKQHPEGFQLEPEGSRLFVNVPRALEISVVDRTTGKQTGTWSHFDAAANFPMAFDSVHQRVLSVYRMPARMKVFAVRDGAVLFSAGTCGDSDDVFVDTKRNRVYVSCGEGSVEVFQEEQGTYRSLGTVRTVSGARTSLFVPGEDRLYVAARARTGEPAAIWIFRPLP